MRVSFLFPSILTILLTRTTQHSSLERKQRNRIKNGRNEESPRLWRKDRMDWRSHVRDARKGRYGHAGC